MLQPLVQVHAARATNSIPQLRLPTRDSATRPELIDLSSYYNGNAHAGWIPGFALGATAEHSLPIPLGTNTWAGIDFDVRGVIQVQSSILAARKGSSRIKSVAFPSIAADAASTSCTAPIGA